MILHFSQPEIRINERIYSRVELQALIGKRVPLTLNFDESKIVGEVEVIGVGEARVISIDKNVMQHIESRTHVGVGAGQGQMMEVTSRNQTSNYIRNFLLKSVSVIPRHMSALPIHKSGDVI
jgi:hypothetical protein